MLLTIRRLTNKLSYSLFIILLINISPFIHGQALWEKAKTGFTQGVSAVGRAISSIDITSSVKQLAQSTASKIKNSVAHQVEKIKNYPVNTIIPQLLANLDKFGQQIGYISDCMFKGQCSEQERAAFIALSITILALTIALVGFTIGIAATSKEIDAHTVAVSEEVKGWSPQAIVARLKNNAASFKQNIVTLQTCLLKRQCTAAQKKGLYATAITLVVLATIVVGVGIGSYIYAQQKEKERTIAAQDAAKKLEPKAPVPILKELSAYTETSPSWKTKFMQQVSKIIQPVKGAGTTLRSAYDTIQQDIKKGIVKTSQEASALFEKIALKAKSIDELVRETLDVNIASALAQFDVLKNQFVSFKNSLPQLWNPQMMALKNQLQTLFNYGKGTVNDLQNARNAWKELNLARIIQAKLTSEREFADKKAAIALEQEQLSREKFKLQQETDAFYEAQAETEVSGSAPQKKPNVLKRIKQKIGKKPEDTSAQIRHQLAEFEKRNQKIAEQERKLNEKLTLLNQQIAFDQFVRKNHLDQIYPTFVQLFNNLHLAYLDHVVGDLLVKKVIDLIISPSSLPLAGKIGFVVAVGYTAAQENINGGIQHIVDGIGRFGKYAQQAIRVQPLVTARDMNTSDVIVALLEPGADIDFIKTAASNIVHLLNMKEPMMQAVNNIEQSINNLEQAIHNFRPNITQSFVNAIKASPLTTIPKAPAVLLASLANGIRDLKIAFINTLKNSAQLFQISLKVVPDAYLIANEFNKFFAKVTGSPFVNPQFMQAVSNMQTESLPDINEGMKILIQSLEADLPADSEEMPG